jgi:hypothetical protein
MVLRDDRRRFSGFETETLTGKSYSSLKTFLSAEPEIEKIEPSDLNRSSLVAKAKRLPIFATSNDACEIVRFLKHHPGDLPVLEVLNSTPRRVFKASKIAVGNLYFMKL